MIPSPMINVIRFLHLLIHSITIPTNIAIPVNNHNSDEDMEEMGRGTRLYKQESFPICKFIFRQKLKK